MKRLFLFAIVTACLAKGQLTRDTPIPDLFEQSDLVFAGKVIRVDQKSPPALDAQGKLAPFDWSIDFSLRSVYKGSAAGPTLQLQIPQRYAPWGAPAAPGMDFLAFARQRGTILTLVDDQAMLFFIDSSTPHTGAGLGLEQIESDLLATGTGHSTESARALEMLFLFPVLSGKSVEALRSFDANGQDERNFLRLELLARQGSPADVEVLLEAALGRDEAALPGSAHFSGILVGQTGMSHLPLLEQFAKSADHNLRFLAMDSIRRIADLSSIPFLVGQLRATDTLVSYVAVMSLAKITGKEGMATDMASFERSPEQYIRPWEDWAANQPVRGKGIIRGTAIDKQGGVIPGATIFAFPMNDGPTSASVPGAITALDGTFAIEHLRFGDYRIETMKEEEGYPRTYSSLYQARTPTTVTITAERPEASLTVSMGPKSAILTVRVTAEDTGQGILASAKVWRKSDPSRAIYMSLNVASKVLLIPPNEDVGIEISATGYVPWTNTGTSINHLASGSAAPLDVHLKRIDTLP